MASAWRLLSEAAGQRFVLVIRDDGVTYGPFDSEDEAEAYAPAHYASKQAYEHAEMNSDFFVAPLMEPSRQDPRIGQGVKRSGPGDDIEEL